MDRFDHLQRAARRNRDKNSRDCKAPVRRDSEDVGRSCPEFWNHDRGGLAQKFEGDGKARWPLGVLRTLVVSVPSRPALGQWAMAPAQTDWTDPDKRKHTGEITNMPSFVRWLRGQYADLTSNFTLDPGLWSKSLFPSMDEQGPGPLCGLKGNKPDLFAKVEGVPGIERRRKSRQAESNWEPCRDGRIRRRLGRTTALEGWKGWKGRKGWTHLRQVLVVEQGPIRRRAPARHSRAPRAKALPRHSPSGTRRRMGESPARAGPSRAWGPGQEALRFSG